MAVQDNSLITLAYFKEVMGITTTSNDTVYEHLINAAADWLERYTGRKLKLATYTDEVYDGSGTNTLNLKQYPVTTLTRIQRRSGYGTSADWTSLSGDTYEIDKVDGQVIIAGNFSNRDYVYRVTYTAGYSDADGALYPIPEDLKLALAQMVYLGFGNRVRDRTITSESLKNYKVTYSSEALSSESRSIFSNYKVYRA